jgi:S-adenosylmethionine synthetase
MKKENLLVYSSGVSKINDTPFEVVERKGIGHPDTLCDTLAEKISQRYSQHCLENYGVVLRHMVDKIALSGGSSKVSFGGGEMQQPIRLYLNCRFTRTYQKQIIPYMEIVQDVVYKHFNNVLPLLDVEKWLQIIDNTHFSPGPGVVYEADGLTKNERQFFFEVPEKKFANFHDNMFRSNDTSTAVGYSPVSKTEKVTLLIEQTLNSTAFKEIHPYVGTDIKVMITRSGKSINATVCIPFIAIYTPSKEFYAERLGFLKNEIVSLISSIFPDYSTTVHLNTRDDPSKSDFYLTLTGSAIESGDEGVVGRGNRYNGVIPFTRHMSMEACCGKNPIYHVGKVYTALCENISQEILNSLGLETYVYLTSQMGRNLSDPWSACVEVCDKQISVSQIKNIEDVVLSCLSNVSKISHKIIYDEIKLY